MDEWKKVSYNELSGEAFDCGQYRRLTQKDHEIHEIESIVDTPELI
jgi:hypothetical protein